MAKTIIGIMGPGSGAGQQDLKLATELGALIARQGWVILTGGRDMGVMNAASKGAHQVGGLTIGILPSGNRDGMSNFIDIPISTGMGSARNNINVLSSDVVVACGKGAGTTSEIMLALKAQKPLILLNTSKKLLQFIQELPYGQPPEAASAKECLSLIRNYV